MVSNWEELLCPVNDAVIAALRLIRKPTISLCG